MLRILRLLIYGRWNVTPLCEHKWKKVDETVLTSEGNGRGYIYTLQCEKCGDCKNFRI